jgi:hypothetical protein
MLALVRESTGDFDLRCYIPSNTALPTSGRFDILQLNHGVRR